MENELILNREAELQAKLIRLREHIVAIEKELSELEVAKSVLARLSVKKQPVTGTVSSTPVALGKNLAKVRQQKPDGLPSIKELVVEALMDARQRGIPGMAPKDIRNYVGSRYNYEMGSSANTVPSRMWRDEKLIDKDTETGLFSLPSKEKPVDANSLDGTPTGFFSNLAKGREAGPGGGT